MFKRKVVHLCWLFLLSSGLHAPAFPETIKTEQAPAGIRNIKDRPLRIELLNNRKCQEKLKVLGIKKSTQESAVVAALGEVIIPPLIDAGIGGVGEGLKYVSGKDREFQTLTGLTNGHFYRTELYRPDIITNVSCILVKVTGNAQIKLKGDEIQSSSKNKSNPWENEILYETLIELVYSVDNPLMYMKPLYVKYSKPLMNLNAVGTALELKILSLGDNDNNRYSQTSTLLLGKVACGKVGSKTLGYIEKDTGKFLPPVDPDYKPCDSSIQGPWMRIPAKASETSLTMREGLLRPVTVEGVLWEVSDYNKFLAKFADILITNKGEIRKAVVGQLPYTVYSPNYEAAAKLAPARVEYQEAKTTYAIKLSLMRPGDQQSCIDALNAWKTMIQKSVAAGVQDSEIDNPPKCRIN